MDCMGYRPQPHRQRAPAMPQNPMQSRFALCIRDDVYAADPVDARIEPGHPTPENEA